MSIGIRLYARAYHQSPDHTRLAVIARQKLIRETCLPCNDCETCSTESVYAVAMCRACLLADKQCIQPARLEGYCLFHDPQLISMCDELLLAPCVTMPRSSVKCLNMYDASLLVMSDHYCECWDTHSESFFLSDNGSRQLIIHVMARHSDLYASVKHVSSDDKYTPSMIYNSDRLSRHGL